VNKVKAYGYRHFSPIVLTGQFVKAIEKSFQQQQAENSISCIAFTDVTALT
jgi:hypothetical protein